MKTLKAFHLVALGILTFAGCSSTKSPDVENRIQKSLSDAGLKDVSTSQDRDKGVVTLTGHVASDSDKTQAESIAKSIAGTQVVSNQIVVTPPGAESEAKKVVSELDKGIEGNLEAAFVKEKLQDDVRYSVKNQVVTLSGEVNSPAKRTRAEKIAAGVPNVQQVVNELQVTKQKARSTK